MNLIQKFIEQHKKTYGIQETEASSVTTATISHEGSDQAADSESGFLEKIGMTALLMLLSPAISIRGTYSTLNTEDRPIYFSSWASTGFWVFAAIALASVLTGGFLPALGMSILSASMLWAGAIGLGATGLFALIDAMGSDAPQERTFKAHIGYFKRWLLPALLLTPIIVLSAGVIPAIAFGGAAGTTVFGSVASTLSATGIATSIWAQLGIMAGAIFGGLFVTQLLGSLSLAISTKFSRKERPVTRAFFRHMAKALHLSGFLSVFALAFSNLPVFAAVKMGLMATPAVGGTITAAAAPVAASTSWMTALPIMAGIYTAISTGLSALYGAVMALATRRWADSLDGDMLHSEKHSPLNPIPTHNDTPDQDPNPRAKAAQNVRHGAHVVPTYETDEKQSKVPQFSVLNSFVHRNTTSTVSGNAVPNSEQTYNTEEQATSSM